MVSEIGGTQETGFKRLRVQGCNRHLAARSSQPTSRFQQPVNGFTLFEILVAITIGSVVVLASTVALHMGLSHIDRGETWLNKTVRDAAVFDFFWQQASSMRAVAIPKPDYLLSAGQDTGEEDSGQAKSGKLYFKGDVDSVSFISPLSLKRHYGYGLVVAVYRLRRSYDGFDLVYSEERLHSGVLMSVADDSFALTDEDDEIVMLEGCDDISFEYLVAGGDSGAFGGMSPQGHEGGDGNLEWIGSIENRLPRAVRIIAQKEEEVRELIAQVMVTYSL